MLPQNPFRGQREFWIKLRLASGDDKTRLRLKQLSSLIFRFAKLYEPKRSQCPLKWISFGQQSNNPVSCCSNSLLNAPFRQESQRGWDIRSYARLQLSLFLFGKSDE
jgi:hypothetical protein